MKPYLSSPVRVILRLVIALLFLILLAAIFLPLLAVTDNQPIPKESRCRNNLKQLGTALLLYAQDNDETLPDRRRWCDAIFPGVKSYNMFACPEGQITTVDPSHPTSGYGWNRLLSGNSLASVTEPATLVVFFDAKGERWNRSGGPELLDPRHNGAANIGFLDGHVKRTVALDALRWDPRPEPHSQGPRR